MKTSERREIAEKFIYEKSTEMSNPWYFDFYNAIQNDYLTEELVEKIINFVHNHPYFGKIQFDIDLGSSGGTSFTESSIDVVSDVILANFISEISECYKKEQFVEYVDLQEIRSWFISVIQSGETSSQCDCRNYCALSFETLQSYPCYEGDIFEEISILAKQKQLSQNEWNWLSLVACNSQSKRIDRKLISIAERFMKLQPSQK